MSKILKRWLRRNLTDNQLDELCAEVYDSWCWEDNDPEDLAVYEFLDTERKCRKMPIIESPITITCDEITITLHDDLTNENVIAICNDMGAMVIASVLEKT